VFALASVRSPTRPTAMAMGHGAEGRGGDLLEIELQIVVPRQIVDPGPAAARPAPPPSCPSALHR